MGIAVTTIDDARDTIYDWIVNILPSRTTLILNVSEMGKPRLPYTTLFVEQTELQQGQVVELSEDGLIETVTSTALLAIVINLYGAAAMGDAVRLKNSLYSNLRYLDLYQTLGLSGVRGLRDLSFLETQHIKQRAELRLDFYARIADIYTSDYFDHLDIVIDGITYEAGENPQKPAASCPLL